MKKQKSDFPYIPVALVVVALGGLIYLGTRSSKKAEASQPAGSGLPFGSLPDVQPGRFEELQERMRQAGYS